MKKLIVINGPAGVGKSTVAELLHEKVKPSFLLSCDSIRRFLNDYHEFPREGRTIRNKVVLSMLDTLLNENMVVIVEQLHTDTVMLSKYEEIGKKHRAETYEFFLWVDSEEELLNRFRKRQEGPTRHPKSSLTEERISKYWHTMKKLKEGRNNLTAIDTTNRTPQSIVEEIIKKSHTRRS